MAVAKDIAAAAAAAHDAGVVHRDLKPGNVFLTLDLGVDAHAVAKVLDFGIAKALEANRTSSSSTGAGALLGSAGYMSPEQLQSAKDVDHRTDVFSLGCILYEMVCGARPFAGENFPAVALATLQSEPAPPRVLSPGIPEPLERLILRALRKNREERPTTMREFYSELGKVATQREAPKVVHSVHEGMGSDTTNAIGDGKPLQVTQMQQKDAPQGFFGATVMGSLLYFKDNDVRLDELRQTFTFYRDHLNREYTELSRQMTTSHTLWLACVGAGFVMLLLGLGILTLGPRELAVGGGATALSSALVYFIVRVFQKREDHYRSLRSEKNKYLEYGNDWLLLIQSIDAISDPTEKMRQQVRLTSVLTQKLERGRGGKREALPGVA